MPTPTPAPTPTPTPTATPLPGGSSYTPTNIRGVNLAGAEFGEGHLPGTYGIDYYYPNSGEVDYFLSLHMNLIRIPFRWERMQRTLFAALDATELSRLDALVKYATSKGAWVMIDPHNYARYHINLIGSSAVPYSAFADFWKRLAAHYASNPKVLFDLGNEPNGVSAATVRDFSNAAITAIRQTGAKNFILVEGTLWTGAWTWVNSGNAEAMQGITDPLNNYAIQVHQYLDADASGSADTCVSSTIGSQRLAEVSSWARTNNKKIFLGEFNFGNNSTCNAAAEDMLRYIDNNLNVWIGWSYWAAGPWWGNALRVIEPINGQDRPQTAILRKYLP